MPMEKTMARRRSVVTVDKWVETTLARLRHEVGIYEQRIKTDTASIATLAVRIETLVQVQDRLATVPESAEAMVDALVDSDNNTVGPIA
jgi:hypothetical protein